MNTILYNNDGKRENERHQIGKKFKWNNFCVWSKKLVICMDNLKCEEFTPKLEFSVLFFFLFIKKQEMV